MKPRWKQQKVGILLTKMRIQPTPGRVVNARLEDAAALFFSRQPRSVVLNIETVLCRRVSSVVSVAVHVGSKCTWTSHSVAWYMLRKRTWRYHAPPHPAPPHPHAMCRRVSSVVSVAVHVGSKCTWTSHSVAWYMLRKRTWRYHAPPHLAPPHPHAMCRRVSSVVSVAVHVGSKCTWTSHSVAWYMLRKRTWRYHAPPHPTPVQCADVLAAWSA